MSELPLIASFSKRVLMPILSYENEISLTHFHMNGRAPGFALIEGLKATRKLGHCSLGL